MKKLLLSLFASFTALLTHAQGTFLKAYIVNLKGDTIRGEARYVPQKEQDLYNKVFFKDPNGIQKNYKPNKTLAYGFENEKRHFIAMDSDGEPKFYEVLARGEINFYKLYFETIQMNEAIFDSEYYIAHPDNKKLVVVKQNKFKKQLTDWMKENPEFINGFEEEKEFNQTKATEVINQYNAWKAGK